MGTGNESDRLLAWAALAEANFAAIIASVLGAEVLDTPRLLRIHTPVPTPLTNPVISRDLPTGDALDALIAETRAYFASVGGPYGWYVTPRTKPQGVAEALTRNGLVRQRGLPVMALDLATLAEHAALPDGCAIEEVRDGDGWTQWGRVLAAGFGMPPAVADPLIAALTALPRGRGTPIRHYLAYREDVPVATTTLHLAGGAAGIYNVATLPEARGRGIGAAVTLAALCEARARGYRVGALHSSAMGHAVYRRMGFVECCMWDHYAEPTTAG